MDETDRDADYTARREAMEEIGLPFPEAAARGEAGSEGQGAGDERNQDIHYLTELPPFLSKYKLVVFPVVYLLTNPEIVLPTLHPSPDEVERMFEHPLEAVLEPETVWTRRREYENQIGRMEKRSSADGRELSEMGGEDWTYQEEYYVSPSSLLSGVLLFLCLFSFFGLF